MGIDAEIAFRATGPIELDWELPPGYTITPASDYTRERLGLEITHQVDCLSRYYEEDYERGHWPQLCAALMLLHACPSIDQVYYGGDCGGVGLLECSPERVAEISLHFMRRGNRK